MKTLIAFIGLCRVLGIKSAIKYVRGTAVEGIDFITIGENDNENT